MIMLENRQGKGTTQSSAARTDASRRRCGSKEIHVKDSAHIKGCGWGVFGVPAITVSGKLVLKQQAELLYVP